MSTLLSQFYAQVQTAGALGLTDINQVAEDVLIPIFKEVYGWQDLENLNVSERPNFPAVDLADERARVAIQVTATPSSAKVKDTLSKFVEHDLHERFDHLIVYVITEKQSTYSGRGFDEIVQGRFQFDKDRDIRDYTDLIEDITAQDFDAMYRVKEILETHFGEGRRFFDTSEREEAEPFFLNLIEVSFPSELYVASESFDRSDVIEGSREDPDLRSLRRNAPPRDVAYSALAQQGERFSQDWHSHADQIITFHDLSDESLPLTKIIDPGTIVELSPEEWYDVNEDYERVFKHLLSRCLSQMLYEKDIQWQYQERCYIYKPPMEGKLHARSESWVGKKKSSRKVYEPTLDTEDPEKLWYAKHFAFDSRFRRFAGQWYLSVKPEWFFSWNGYKRYSGHGDKVDWLKRRERNQQVFNHVRFAEHQLKYDKPPELFDGRPNEPYPFLSFGSLVELEGHPSLPDGAWHAMETPEEKEQLLQEESVEKRSEEPAEAPDGTLPFGA